MTIAPTANRTPPVVGWFFVLVAVVFTCVYPFIASINNPNENVRTYETMAIVEDHTFRFDRILEEYGWVNDMAVVPEPDGSRHYFSVKAPGTTYGGVPFYWAMTKIAPRLGHPVPTVKSPPAEKEWWFRATTFVVRLFSVQLPCLVFLIWFERWLRGVSADPALRLSAVVAAGLGTNYLAYALAFVSHATFAVAAFASFAITTRERELHPLDPRQRRLSRAFLAGFFAGLATLLEYHAFPVSVLLALYALTTFWRPTRIAMLALGGMIDVAALAFFQWRAFHNPLTPGHKFSENPVFQHNLSQGVYGIEKPDFEVFKSISFDLTFGFFGTSPFMWLGFLAIPMVLIVGFGHGRERSQRRGAAAAWMLMMLALWTTVSAANNWRGGWTVGPRYLGAAPPFFAYGALCALEAIAGRSPWKRAAMRGVAGGAAVASVITIGLTGMHFNTMPEDVLRPFRDVTWPLAVAGFVPYHALEAFGVKSPAFWYVVAACAIGAALLAALAPWKEGRFTWPLRAAVAAFVLIGASYPALHPARELGVTDKGAVTDGGPEWRRRFAEMWRPPARDRITTLRDEAERYGDRRPCLWRRLSKLEELVNDRAGAARDAKRGGDPATLRCASFIDRVDSLLSPPEASPAPGPAGPSSGTSTR